MSALFNGVSDERAEEWSEDKNSYEMKCVIVDQGLRASYGDVCFECLSNGPGRFVFRPVEFCRISFYGSTIKMKFGGTFRKDFLGKIQGDDYSGSSCDNDFCGGECSGDDEHSGGSGDDEHCRTLGYYKYMSDDDDETPYVKHSVDDRISTFCWFGQEVFFVLACGIIVKTRVTSSFDETFKLLRNMFCTHRCEIYTHGRRNFRKIETSDGEHLFVRDTDGNLYMIKWSSYKRSTTIDTSTQNFQVLGDSVVFLTGKGTLKLMRFALEKTEYSIVDLPTEKAKHFLAVPSKQHLWILTLDNRVIRYSLRSPPPALRHGDA
jgi:hypothetical protein